MSKYETASEEDVRKVLEPELNMISDLDLGEKAVKAWTMACKMGGYENLEDCPLERFEDLPTTSNIDHQKETARFAAAIVKVIKELGNQANVNEDYVITAALCHDLGKPVEWRANASGIFYNGVYYGKNSEMPHLEDTSYQVVRHPIWGFYIALTVGMPLRVAHAIGMHSMEGTHIQKTPEARIVSIADHLWWQLIGDPKVKNQARWREKRAIFVEKPGNVLKRE
jgi:putative nucleotidyltransferase with HDIG domain